MSAQRVLAVAISSLALMALAIPAARARPSRAGASVPNSLDLAARHIDKNIVDERSTEMRGIKYGAEGGEVLRDRHGLYHWFTSEQYGDPYWVANRIAHWTSVDGRHWHRDPRWVKEGNHDTTGTRDRSNYFDPTMAWDARTGYWYMFYVGYRYSTDPTAWHLAKIYRAKAMRRGLDGLSGPYHDQDSDDIEVMGPVAHPGPYEATRVGNSSYGLGGDSVTVFPVGDHWVMLWCEVMLATAPSPSGTFTRLPEGPDNPVSYGTKPMTFDPKAAPFHPERFWLENPIVVRIPHGAPGAGTYLMVVGNFVDVRIAPQDKGYAFGYRPLCGWATSPDGIRWSKVKPLDLGLGDCMTVDSALPERDGSITMYVTAHTKGTSDFERLSRVELVVTPWTESTRRAIPRMDSGWRNHRLSREPSGRIPPRVAPGRALQLDRETGDDIRRPGRDSSRAWSAVACRCRFRRPPPERRHHQRDRTASSQHAHRRSHRIPTRSNRSLL